MLNLTMPTIIFIVVTVLAIAAYDIFALIKYGSAGTISMQLLTLAKAYPVIPFALGFICGHLFWLNT